MAEAKTRILIADVHAILRNGLRHILEAECDMTVVGEAANGQDAVKRVKQLQPDLVIMDISMTEQDGIESLRRITSSLTTRVLILSVHSEPHLILEAVSAGVCGYLGKDTLEHELVSAIRTIVHGGTVFSPNVSKLLVEFSLMGGTASAGSLSSLTDREREAFLMLAEGKSPSEVAMSLSVSARTVHVHRKHILDKLKLRTTTGLIRFALRQGLIKNV